MQSENYADFTVFIENEGSNKGIIVEATSMDTEISFNNVQIVDDIASMKKIHRFERSVKSYPGPDFATLDERIQTSFSETMQAFGINEHLAAFVECMSLDKDQRLYMQWLNDLSDFI
mmetsp:Transcript_20951/g.15372  ORF Transcript_20951/g.15372 Transcript_20951/m.15372 type:complete len:117 (+) Transcript_20951:434-784(+)